MSNKEKFDVIVVGAGISGLLIALALSKEGKKVLILEKESFIGGVCRSYDVNGYTVDTGVHAITRLENGPLRELINRYFEIEPKFTPFGTYYVRNNGKLKPFPWNIHNWITFDLLPSKDRILLMKPMLKTAYKMKTGQDLSAVSIKDLLPSDISNTTYKFIDWLSYFMLGTSMENAPISRFIDNKTNKSKNIHFVEKLYNLFITEGAVDQGYPIAGLQSIPDSILSSFPKNKVEIKTNEEVIKIHGDEEIKGVDTKNESYDCDIVIYSGPSSHLPELYNKFPKTYVKNLKSIKNVNSLTIWLGLNKKIFDNIGSEMWIHSDPFAWVSSTSNYNPKLAPKGKQLAGFSFVLPNEYNSGNVKKRALNTIFDTIPDIENNVDMIHYQELVPEKASWDLNSGFGDVKTPIKKLYTVGTDTIKRSAGVSRAAYSVLKCLEIMKSDEVV